MIGEVVDYLGFLVCVEITVAVGFEEMGLLRHGYKINYRFYGFYKIYRGYSEDF